MNQPRISLIAAMDANGVIGASGGMPWHLPDDLRWFKQNTRDKPILMGRRTFESIGRALPHRRNMVLTRRADIEAADIETVDAFDAALARVAGAAELMVIGGAQVYTLALPYADRLLITRIDAEYTGDTWFPAVDWRHWRLIADDPRPPVGETPGYRFMTYERIAG
ncbi:dihydrofolate reductase [Salinisphaera hydrothermalis]|uniref:Dihydrofolate reductase n=1 Tax=Salinisphaera hydrothermalis (strain C41B8) TaxID=1304275 RepID=A0A084ILI5_SALHC|nr:dihydrofolate reductase [Salinisphaera hydrothermalis]KEZ77569.1 dihydrofolate reductase [Salinisphaera hydrothermalis C41B8]